MRSEFNSFKSFFFRAEDFFHQNITKIKGKTMAGNTRFLQKSDEKKNLNIGKTEFNTGG